MQGEGVAKVTPSHPSIATFPLPTPHNSKNPPPPPWVAIYRSYILSMPSSQITQPISLVKHPKERVQRGFAGMYLFPRSKSFLLVLLQSIQSQHVSKPYSAGHVMLKQKLFFLKLFPVHALRCCWSPLLPRQCFQGLSAEWGVHISPSDSACMSSGISVLKL